MKIVTATEAQEIGLKNLRLNQSSFDFRSPAVIAAAIRRAASFLCPCPTTQLIQNAFRSQELLIDEPVSLKAMIADMLESIIGYGDLIEETDAITNAAEQRGRILYLRPPSFVWRDGESALLVGVAPDDVLVLPTALQNRVEHLNHIRRLPQQAGEDLRAELKRIGLTELLLDVWNRKNSVPANEAPLDYIRRHRQLLKNNPGSFESLLILNPQKNDVRYYSKRWESAKNQNGLFIARRPQLYGNDLWCYVELTDGKPTKLADFPLLNKRSPGRDEAWRLQMAIDAAHGRGQVYSVEELIDLHYRIKFYSPIPSWAQRRLDNLGEPAGNTDCLFSYRIPGADLGQETKFLADKLWLVRED